MPLCSCFPHLIEELRNQSRYVVFHNRKVFPSRFFVLKSFLLDEKLELSVLNSNVLNLFHYAVLFCLECQLRLAVSSYIEFFVPEKLDPCSMYQYSIPRAQIPQLEEEIRQNLSHTKRPSPTQQQLVLPVLLRKPPQYEISNLKVALPHMCTRIVGLNISLPRLGCQT